ncbi:MAG TPA: DnaA/Hda family protein [Gemmataceae bacterium]|nr:DnaA/Hda family protein [Gemmataceae bacterium]
MSSCTHFVPAPENQSALAAVRSVAACLCSQRVQRIFNPLYLHGLPGTGKTHLISELVEDVTQRMPRIVISIQSASDVGLAKESEDDQELKGDSQSPKKRTAADFKPKSSAPSPEPASAIPDLLIVEDLQHLGARRANQAAVLELFVQTVDERLARQQQIVFTASTGPARIAHFPARLVSRLAGGLVVGLEPLGAASRLALLHEKAQQRQLAVGRDVLAWLAANLPGGTRQLLGALLQLEAFSRGRARPLDVAAVAEHFRPLVEATELTVERIAERVGSCFQVPPRDLQSQRRSRGIVMPRQVGMYLARQLTPLSLSRIGAYFGGRDHSTVLHACAKVEHALTADQQLSGVVRQLQAELR